MGSWMARLLEERGHRVLCAGRSTALSPAEMAQRCDVVVISVPIADTVAIIREVGPLVPENGVLMDLASIKKAPMEAMLKYSRAEVVGVHPLFGPDILPESEPAIAICPGRGEKGLKWISGIFLSEGFRISHLDPEEHDRMMGLIQGVNHFSTLSLAFCIRGSGFRMEDLRRASTLTFDERLNRIRSLIGQQAELFGSLLTDNPYAMDFIRQYRASVEALFRIIREKDKKAFEEQFESLKSFFDDHETAQNGPQEETRPKFG